MKKPRTAGDAFNAVETEMGALLDFTLPPSPSKAARERMRAEILETLSPRWRNWSESRTGNALKLQVGRNPGRTIDSVVKRFPKLKMSIVVLDPPDKKRAIQTMSPWWRYVATWKGHYAGPEFVLRRRQPSA